MQYTDQQGRNTSTDTDLPHLTPTEARSGIKTGRIRYVLVISLGLAIVAMAALLIYYTH